MISVTPRTWPVSVGILIPAYKAREALKQFLPDLLERVPRSAVCVVDDGSRDWTDVVCRDMGIACLVNDSNRGKGSSLVRGFAHWLTEGKEWVITMDADGQHSPADLDKFLRATQRIPAAGIVIGARRKRIGAMPPARIFSNVLTSTALSLLTHCPIRDCQCGYRAYSTRFLRNVPIRFRHFEMETEVILKACAMGLPVRSVSIHTLYFRDFGNNYKSQISHVRDTIRWMRAVVETLGEIRREGR
jgi:glycosyltransferase involved in cell wall biosynthesis